MFVIAKLLVILALAVFGVLTAFAHYVGVVGDPASTAMVYTFWLYLTHVFKASVIIPYAFHRWVKPKFPRWFGGPVEIMLAFFWCWFLMFHPLFFFVGSFLLGYFFYLFDHLVNETDQAHIDRAYAAARHHRDDILRAGRELPGFLRSRSRRMPGGTESVASSEPLSFPDDDAPAGGGVPDDHPVHSGNLRDDTFMAMFRKRRNPTRNPIPGSSTDPIVKPSDDDDSDNSHKTPPATPRGYAA